MGVTGAGKSTFISLLSGEDIQIGHGQQSCKPSLHKWKEKFGLSMLPFNRHDERGSVSLRTQRRPHLAY